LGRWLRRDPIEEVGGWNLYNMLANSPINWRGYLGYVGLFNE
jgi:RHS repeat-associated protein